MTHRISGESRAGRPIAPAFALVFLQALTLSPTASATDEPRKIAWREDLAQAQAEAKSRNLLLWIQFTGSWCINCRRMDRATFTHAGIVTESRERFVPVKLRSDEHEALAQSLGLTSLPATVVVRPNGEMIDKWEGYGDPDEFGGFLTMVLRRENRSPEQVALAKAKAAAKKDGEVGLAGYCPVRLIQERKLVPGKPELTLEHSGRVYRFASAADRAEFLRKPWAFAPVNEGRCPVSQVDRGDFLNGDPRFGVVYDGHLFVFKDAAERDRFARDPERYAHVGVDGLGTCAHCRSQERLARLASSRFSASRRAEARPVVEPARLEAWLGSDSTLRR
jgi:thioredoxin-related protein